MKELKRRFQSLTAGTTLTIRHCKKGNLKVTLERKDIKTVRTMFLMGLLELEEEYALYQNYSII